MVRVTLARGAAIGALVGCVGHDPYVVRRAEYASAVRALIAGAPGPQLVGAFAAGQPKAPVVQLKATHAMPIRGALPLDDTGELMLVSAVDFRPPHLAAGWSLFGVGTVLETSAITRFVKEGADSGQGYGLMAAGIVLFGFAAWQLALAYGDEAAPFVSESE